MLWPAGHMPDSAMATKDAEVLKSDTTNWISLKCCPGDTSKFYFNVNTPTLVPFLNLWNPTKAAIVVIPGGGHDFLAWEKEGTDIAQWLNELGYSAFVLKYRVPAKGVLAPLSIGDRRATCDAQRAMSMVRASAKAHGVDPHKIGVIGFSAGGGMAYDLAASPTRQYKPLDAVDRVSFTPDFMLLVYPAVFTLWPSLSKPPPTFMAVAGDDPCTPALVVKRGAAMLRAAQGKVELHEYPDGKHGYGRCTIYYGGKKGSVCQWVDRAREFLTRATSGFA